MEPSFILLTLALCLLSRGCSVFPLAALANMARSRSHRIKMHEQAVIWFSGLRGAIALALAVEFPTAVEVHGTPGQGNFCYQREHVVACTIVVVMCTVFILGGFTKPMLNLCGVQMGVPEGAEGSEPSAAELSPVQRVERQRVERQTTRLSKHWVKRAVVTFDRGVLRPVLVADYQAGKSWAEQAPPQLPTASPAQPPPAQPHGAGDRDDAMRNNERL